MLCWITLLQFFPFWAVDWRPPSITVYLRTKIQYHHNCQNVAEGRNVHPFHHITLPKRRLHWGQFLHSHLECLLDLLAFLANPPGLDHLEWGTDDDHVHQRQYGWMYNGLLCGSHPYRRSTYMALCERNCLSDWLASWFTGTHDT